jgi:hypothetical protein
MVALKIIVAAAIAGILSNMTGYLISGRIFHKYQAQTPNTWRAGESWAHYSYSAGVRLLSCLAIVILYHAFGGSALALFQGGVLGGAAFGACLWAAMTAPLILEVALFVNWHRGFVVGLLLDWLVVSIIAGMAAAILLPAA